MKNLTKLLAIIALVALIGFSMVAFEDGVGGPGPGYNPGGGTGGTGGTGGGGRSAGTLTITGIPRPTEGGPNGWFVYVYPSGTPLSTWDDIMNLDYGAFESYNSGLTETGSTFELLILVDGIGRAWTGSGSRSVLLLDTQSSDYDAKWFSATVNFSNGSATVPWSSFRVIRLD